MAQKVKEMAPKILEAIKEANHILLHFHPSPDPDTVGSSLAMYQALLSMGKKVTLIKGDSEPPAWVRKMPCADKITKKNYLELDKQGIDLFIIHDSSSPSMVTNLGEVEFSMKTVVIDHHISNSEYGDINLVDATYVATCHITFDLLNEWGMGMTPEMASCLFLGMYTDSGGFRYKPVSRSTYEAAGKLWEINPNLDKVVFELENNNTPDRLKFEGLALSNINSYFEGRVAISEVTYKMIREKKITPDATHKANIANMIKSVVGWDLGISMIEEEEGMVNLSMRTRDFERFDLSKLALSMDGGGHKAAAGAKLQMSFDEAKKTLLEKITETFPELGQP